MNILFIIPVTLMYIPSVAIAIVPNRWWWLAGTVLVLLLPFGGLIWEALANVIMGSQNFKPLIVSILCSIPAIFSKCLAIIARNRKCILASRLLPFLGLLGPTEVVFWRYFT